MPAAAPVQQSYVLQQQHAVKQQHNMEQQQASPFALAKYGVEQAHAAAAAAAPAVEVSRHSSLGGSRRSSLSPVASWLAGWTRIAEQQGCAANELEGSFTQQLLQRSSLPRSCSCPLPGCCTCSAGVLAPAAVGLSQPSVALSRPPRQPQLGLTQFQDAAPPAQPALSNGSSNSASCRSDNRCGGVGMAAGSAVAAAVALALPPG